MSEVPYPLYQKRLQTLGKEILRQRRVTNRVGHGLFETLSTAAANGQLRKIVLFKITSRT